MNCVVAIGNSDNKLSQMDWCQFVGEVSIAIDSVSEQVHFSGGSEHHSPYQNYAWIFEVNSMHAYGTLVDLLRRKCHSFNQDSIFLMTGSPVFVTQDG